jgi:hypothetical protein
MTKQRVIGGIGLAFLLVAAACWIGYRLIGSEIDAEGVLHEPFGLIPLGWLSLFGALIAGAVYAFLVSSRPQTAGPA